MSLITKTQITIIQVSDGAPGDPGTPGVDGVSLVTWVRYADNPDGSGGMYTDPIGRAFIGRAYNKNPTDPVSTDPADYTWEPFFMAVVASDLEIIAGGQIRSGYDENGNPPASGCGFFLGADGKLKAKDGDFTGNLVGTHGRLGCLSSEQIDISPTNYPYSPVTVGDLFTLIHAHVADGEEFACDIDYNNDKLVRGRREDGYSATYGDAIHFEGEHGNIIMLSSDSAVQYPWPFVINNLARTSTLLSNLMPGVDNAIELGSSSKRFRKINAVSLYGLLFGNVQGNLTGQTNGSHFGNVNSQGTGYKVWGAVAN